MDRRFTVLQVVPALDAGGAEQTCVEIAAALTAAGHRAVAAGAPGRLVAPFEAAGGTFVPLPLAAKSPARLWANAGRLARLIEEEAIDVVHARSRAPAWSALLAARRTGAPLVTTYHGIYGEGWAGKRLYNSVMARGQVVIANSAFTADLVAQRYRTPPGRIEVIHRGIDPAVFDPSAVEPARVARLRAAWRVGEGDRVVLLPGRLTAWKGQETAIAAIARLGANGGGRAVLVLAGDAQGRGDYAAGLEALAARAGVRVHLAGHVGDMPAAYLAADAVLSASQKPEAFGRVVVEAGAMGAPVVATALGAMAETVLAPPAVTVAARTGWLVPPADPGAMAGALAVALGLDPPARAALAARARAHVLARFTLADMAAATLRVYHRVLAGNDRATTAGAIP